MLQEKIIHDTHVYFTKEKPTDDDFMQMFSRFPKKFRDWFLNYNRNHHILACWPCVDKLNDQKQPVVKYELGQISYTPLYGFTELRLTILDHDKRLIEVPFDLTARPIDWKRAINQAQELPF